MLIVGRDWRLPGDWPAWLGQGRRCLAPVELHTALCVSTWTLPCPVRPRDVVARWVDPVAVAELMLCGAGWVMGDVGMMGQDALSLESRAPWASGTTLTRTLRVALFRPLPVGTPWEVLSGPSRSHKSCGHRLHCCAGPTSGGHHLETPSRGRTRDSVLPGGLEEGARASLEVVGVARHR